MKTERITATEIIKRQKEANEKFQKVWDKLTPFEKLAAYRIICYEFRGLMGVDTQRRNE